MLVVVALAVPFEARAGIVNVATPAEVEAAIGAALLAIGALRRRRS